MGNTITNTNNITNNANNATNNNTSNNTTTNTTTPRVIEMFYVRITRKVYIDDKVRTEKLSPTNEYIEMLLDRTILPSIAKTTERDVVIERIESSIGDTLLVIASARNSTTRQFLISVLTKIQFKFSLDEEIGLEIADDPILRQL